MARPRISDRHAGRAHPRGRVTDGQPHRAGRAMCDTTARELCVNASREKAVGVNTTPSMRRTTLNVLHRILGNCFTRNTGRTHRVRISNPVGTHPTVPQPFLTIASPHTTSGVLSKLNGLRVSKLHLAARAADLPIVTNSSQSPSRCPFGAFRSSQATAAVQGRSQEAQRSLAMRRTSACTSACTQCSLGGPLLRRCLGRLSSVRAPSESGHSFAD
jgi:hypothetical protein